MATTAKRLTLAGKIDAILKLSVVVSVLLASSSVGYYYLVHLPHREAAAIERAEQVQLFFEQQAWPPRSIECGAPRLIRPLTTIAV